MSSNNSGSAIPSGRVSQLDSRLPVIANPQERVSSGPQIEDAGVALKAVLLQTYPDLPDRCLKVRVEDLLSSVCPPELDLYLVDFDASEVLSDILPILQSHARLLGEAEISAVILNKETVVNAALVDGLKQLGALCHVSVRATADNGLVDFGDLRSLQSVHIVGNPKTAMQIIVPDGVTVEATGTSTTALQKALVFYKNSGGVVSNESRPLHGQRYYRTADEFFQADTQEEAQQVSKKISLNGAASMSITDPVTGEVRLQPIVCRHLVWTWLNPRTAHRAARVAASIAGELAGSSSQVARADVSQEGAGERYSYRELLDTKAIRRKADMGVEVAFDQMVMNGSSALFEAGSPGPMLAAKLAGLRSGQSSHHVVTTNHPYHALGIELRVRMRMHGGQLRPEYVVNLFDPNSTGTHQHLVVDDPSKLMEMNLGDWFKSNSVASLYDWPAAQEQPSHQPTAPAVYVESATIATGEFLFSALHDGHTALMRQSVRCIAAQAATLGSQALEMQLLAGSAGKRGLHYVAVDDYKRPAMLSAFVLEVLAIRGDVLDLDAKCRVLQAQCADGLVLDRILVHGAADSMQAMLGAILTAPGLTPQARLHLLMSPTTSGQPILHRFCSAEIAPPLATRERLACYKTLRDFVAQVVSLAALSEDDKKLFCASAYGPGNARVACGRHALDAGDRGAAVAILMGIFDSTAGPHVKNALIQEMGVTTQEMVMRMRSTMQHPADRNWARVEATEVEAAAAALATALATPAA